MQELSKEEKIKKEINRLKRIYKDIEVNRKQTIEGLISEAAYMRVTLEELRNTIDTEGVIDIMPQGDYSIKREHPAMRIYNTTIQRYTSITKQLTDLLPKEIQKEVDDGFNNFIIGRDA